MTFRVNTFTERLGVFSALDAVISSQTKGLSQRNILRQKFRENDEQMFLMCSKRTDAFEIANIPEQEAEARHGPKKAPRKHSFRHIPLEY